MVSDNPFRRSSAALLLLLILSSSALVQAAVVATIDRAAVELNESFTLKLIVDSEIAAIPDVSPLENDFFVGQGSQLSNTTGILLIERLVRCHPPTLIQNDEDLVDQEIKHRHLVRIQR